MDDTNLTPAEEQLLTTLAAEGEAVTQHAAEGNLHTAMEHLHVAPGCSTTSTASRARPRNCG